MARIFTNANEVERKAVQDMLALLADPSQDLDNLDYTVTGGRDGILGDKSIAAIKSHGIDPATASFEDVQKALSDKLVAATAQLDKENQLEQQAAAVARAEDQAPEAPAVANDNVRRPIEIADARNADKVMAAAAAAGAAARTVITPAKVAEAAPTADVPAAVAQEVEEVPYSPISASPVADRIAIQNALNNYLGDPNATKGNKGNVGPATRAAIVTFYEQTNPIEYTRLQGLQGAELNAAIDAIDVNKLGTEIVAAVDMKAARAAEVAQEAQKAAKEAQDAVINPLLASNGNDTLTFGPHSEANEAAQTILTQRGFDTKGVDGYLGNKTEKAIAMVEATNGVVLDRSTLTLSQLAEAAATAEAKRSNGLAFEIQPNMTMDEIAETAAKAKYGTATAEQLAATKQELMAYNGKEAQTVHCKDGPSYQDVPLYVGEKFYLPEEYKQTDIGQINTDLNVICTACTPPALNTKQTGSRQSTASTPRGNRPVAASSTSYTRESDDPYYGQDPISRGLMMLGLPKNEAGPYIPCPPRAWNKHPSCGSDPSTPSRGGGQDNPGPTRGTPGDTGCEGGCGGEDSPGRGGQDSPGRGGGDPTGGRQASLGTDGSFAVADASEAVAPKGLPKSANSNLAASRSA